MDAAADVDAMARAIVDEISFVVAHSYAERVRPKHRDPRPMLPPGRRGIGGAQLRSARSISAPMRVQQYATWRVEHAALDPFPRRTS